MTDINMLSHFVDPIQPQVAIPAHLAHDFFEFLNEKYSTQPFPNNFCIPLMSYDFNNKQTNVLNEVTCKCQEKVRQNEVSYEKSRIARAISEIKDFNIEQSEPFKWMMHSFGRIITQKEFNQIYVNLKAKLPQKFSPKRNENRSQFIRFVWLNSIWNDFDSRKIVQNEFRSVIPPKRNGLFLQDLLN
ncbi:hypothetical protein TRFO_06582 [Tritrichomonas foetus]|uniref:Uncharacterized protein n=1 Tax=Tritrichomonas foetus TaxID=1144522 RepID=A0A1J4JZ32_9EUKA|nr:hypothetical protein TRFO_06582 [Tritrichomonas foetus]|eukprot:OHT03744.1 hypothetical protein TRFO_06582 [Tritrichomonas foetus]